MAVQASALVASGHIGQLVSCFKTDLQPVQQRATVRRAQHATVWRCVATDRHAQQCIRQLGQQGGIVWDGQRLVQVGVIQRGDRLDDAVRPARQGFLPSGH